MMECNVRVNGGLIANIYLHNKGHKGYDSDLCDYYYEVYDCPGEVKAGDISHYRSDGWKVLIKDILEQAIFDENKEN